MLSVTSNDIHNNAGGPSKSSSSVMKKPGMSPLDAIRQSSPQSFLKA